MVRRLFLLANRVSRVIAPCQSSLGAGDGERPVRPGEILRGASAKESNFMAISQSGIDDAPPIPGVTCFAPPMRSEEHTSELQSLMRISYAVFCLKKKNLIMQTHILAKHIKH